MNAKVNAPLTISRTARARFNPIKNLRPDTLSRALESFEDGRLGQAARIFEAILKRDDMICGLNLKRKKSVARLESEISVLENSERAFEHKRILSHFYSTIEARSFDDRNVKGGLRALVSQMMDAVGMKYSVHKISLREQNGEVTGTFEQHPLWMFENTGGSLRRLEREGQLTAGAQLRTASG